MDKYYQCIALPVTQIGSECGENYLGDTKGTFVNNQNCTLITHACFLFKSEIVIKDIISSVGKVGLVINTFNE